MCHNMNIGNKILNVLTYHNRKSKYKVTYTYILMSKMASKISEAIGQKLYPTRMSETKLKSKMIKRKY